MPVNRSFISISNVRVESLKSTEQKYLEINMYEVTCRVIPCTMYYFYVNRLIRAFLVGNACVSTQVAET